MAAVWSSPVCPQTEISPAPEKYTGVLVGCGETVGVGCEEIIVDEGIEVGAVVLVNIIWSVDFTSISGELFTIPPESEEQPDIMKNILIKKDILNKSRFISLQ
jgi:hypothetical protein